MDINISVLVDTQSDWFKVWHYCYMKQFYWLKKEHFNPLWKLKKIKKMNCFRTSQDKHNRAFQSDFRYRVFSASKIASSKRRKLAYIGLFVNKIVKTYEEASWKVWWHLNEVIKSYWQKTVKNPRYFPIVSYLFANIWRTIRPINATEPILRRSRHF